MAVTEAKGGALHLDFPLMPLPSQPCETAAARQPNPEPLVLM